MINVKIKTVDDQELTVNNIPYTFQRLISVIKETGGMFAENKERQEIFIPMSAILLITEIAE